MCSFGHAADFNKVLPVRTTPRTGARQLLQLLRPPHQHTHHCSKCCVQEIPTLSHRKLRCLTTTQISYKPTLQPLHSALRPPCKSSENAAIEKSLLLL